MLCEVFESYVCWQTTAAVDHDRGGRRRVARRGVGGQRRAQRLHARVLRRAAHEPVSAQCRCAS